MWREGGKGEGEKMWREGGRGEGKSGHCLSSLHPVVSVLNKTWCIEHFRCTGCDTLLASSR